MSQQRYIGAIDQGTTSTRFIIFNEKLQHQVEHQLEHKQLTPKPGWLEHDPQEIADNVVACATQAIAKMRVKEPSFAGLSSVGITNQRETTVAWDRVTGKPLCNAIVWSDLRTVGVVADAVKANGGHVHFAQEKCGLPVSTYFSAMKMRWMLLNVPEVQRAASNNTLCFGTIDSWVIWRLTNKAVFATDVTNASRTMLMNLSTLAWDDDLCKAFLIPKASLPQIRSSSEVFGVITDKAFGDGVRISGCIGDQQGALVGNLCFKAGEAKNTYGTGCFLLANVGTAVPKPSKAGLLSTVGYRLGPSAPCVYALEGSVAGAGSTVQWMRDRMGLFAQYSDVDHLASSVPDCGGVTFVPAFTGLLAPHWDPTARGSLFGMTLQTTKAHVVRAALEAISMQVADIVRAVESDTSIPFTVLKVDGGLVRSRVLMTLQADDLGIPVMVPPLLETTALGAAICAGLAVGIWASPEAIADSYEHQTAPTVVQPKTTKQERERAQQVWNRAVERAMGWAKL